MKYLFTYFTTLLLIIISSKAFAVDKPIISDEVPFVFKATLQSIDSTNTAIFLWEYKEKELNHLIGKGLDESNYGNYNDGHIIIRIGISGAPEEPIGKEAMGLIKDQLLMTDYELTCYSIDKIPNKSHMPICYAEDKNGTAMLVHLHNATKKYFPLNYNLDGNNEKMNDLLRDVEKNLIISDFML